MLERVGDIAARIKGLRILSGISEVEVANATNIPVEKYIKYENAEDDFPVSALYEIADYLKVDMTEILTGVSPKLHDACYVKKGEGLRIERYDEYEFQSLAYKYSNRKIEPLFVTLDPANNPELVSHKGQEFNYCLEGRMKVVVGNEDYILESGDSLYFNSMIPHKMLAMDDKTSKFITVILL